MANLVFQTNTINQDGSSSLGTTLTAVGTQNATLTAAQLLGGYIEHTVITAAGTDTTDTGTNLDATVSQTTGAVFNCLLVNTAASALAITIAAGSGVTIKGSTATVAQNKTALLTFRRTGTAAWTCYVTVSA